MVDSESYIYLREDNISKLADATSFSAFDLRVLLDHAQQQGREYVKIPLGERWWENHYPRSVHE